MESAGRPHDDAPSLLSASSSSSTITWNPTARLPPLRTRPSVQQLKEGLNLVRALYIDHVYAPSLSLSLADSLSYSSSSSAAHAQDARYSHGDGDQGGMEDGEEEAYDTARADETEKRFAFDWCMKLMALDLHWLGDAQQATDVQERASRLLAAEAVVEEGGDFDQTLVFPLPHAVRSGAQASAPAQEAHESYTVLIRDAVLPPARCDSTESVADSESQFSRSTDTEASASASAEDPSSQARQTPPPPPPQQQQQDHITARSQDAATAVGVQTWGSALVLCDVLSRDASRAHPSFSPAAAAGRSAGSSSSSTSSRRPFRILELGSGTGLVGMLLVQLAQRQGVRDVSATLTDYHSLVMDNLEHNIRLNFPAAASSSSIAAENTGGEHDAAAPRIECRVLDWSDVHDVVQAHEPHAKQQSNGKASHWWASEAHAYDLVVATDVIYSPAHATWLLSCFDFFLSRSASTNTDSESRALLLCPVRLNGRFGEWDLISKADDIFAKGSDGVSLVARQALAKIKGIGREDERSYVFWTFAPQTRSDAA